MLIGTIRDRSGGDKGKIPINDESLNNHISPIVSHFMEESPIKGTFESVLDLKSDVHKSN